MALDGIRFPQEMIEKTTFVDGDKIMMSDSEDSKKVKFFTFSSLKTYISGIFTKKDATNLVAADVLAWQNSLDVAFLKNSINDGTIADVYLLEENGFYSTSASTSNLPDTNKIGYLTIIISGDEKYLNYLTFNDSLIENWNTYYDGIVWSSWDKLGVDAFTSFIELSNSSTETPSGVPTSQNTANEEYTASINAILDELSRLASASASLVGENIPILISTTETAIPFITTSPSSDTDIIELDDVTDTVSMKKAGRYNWLTSLEIENSSNNTDYTATIRTRRVSDNLLLTTRDISIPSKTTRTDFRAVLYDLPDGDEPQDVYLTIQGTSNTNLSLTKYESTLSVGGVVGASSDVNVKVSSNDTTTGKLFDKIKFGDEFLVETINPSGNENLLTKFKGWIFNSARAFKHIISSIATADRTQILQDKDGTIALLSDIVIGHSVINNSLLNLTGENILGAELNVGGRIFLEGVGTISKIEIRVYSLGSNPNELLPAPTIMIQLGGVDLFSVKQQLVAGLNVFTTFVSATYTDNQEIELFVIDGTGQDDISDAYIKIYN